MKEHEATVGLRVHHHFHPHRKGTIRRIENGQALVEWDDGYMLPAAPFIQNLDKELENEKVNERPPFPTMPEEISTYSEAERYSSALRGYYRVGDRVRYRNRYCGLDWREGEEATVVRVPIAGDSMQVQWQDGFQDDYYIFNFDPVEGAQALAEDEVAKALAVLRKHGKVTFEPEWKVQRIRLNDKHTAEVFSGNVRVGCQSFDFDRILALAEVVKQAKAHKEKYKSS